MSIFVPNKYPLYLKLATNIDNLIIYLNENPIVWIFEHYFTAKNIPKSPYNAL